MKPTIARSTAVAGAVFGAVLMVGVATAQTTQAQITSIQRTSGGRAKLPNIRVELPTRLNPLPGRTEVLGGRRFKGHDSPTPLDPYTIPRQSSIDPRRFVHDLRDINAAGGVSRRHDDLIPAPQASAPLATDPGGLRDESRRRPPGLSARGEFDDGRFRAVISLNSGFSFHGPRVLNRSGTGFVNDGVLWWYGRRSVPHVGYIPPLVGYEGTWLTGCGSYDPRPIVGVLYTADTRTDPALSRYYDPDAVPAASPPVDTRTPMQRALDSFSAGDAERALSAGRAALKESPEDARALRIVGLSHLVLGNTAEAVEMLSRAYSDQPELMDDDLSAAPFWLSEDGLRTLTGKVVEVSNRTKSPSALVAAAVLLHARGNVAAALRTLEKAKAAGLSPETADQLNRAIGGGTLAAPSK